MKSLQPPYLKFETRCKIVVKLHLGLPDFENSKVVSGSKVVHLLYTISTPQTKIFFPNEKASFFFVSSNNSYRYMVHYSYIKVLALVKNSLNFTTMSTI